MVLCTKFGWGDSQTHKPKDIMNALTTTSSELHRTWRHHQPSFEKAMVKIPMALRLAAIVDKHDWSKNPFIAALRRNGATLRTGRGEKIIAPRRRSIRREREETLTALAKAILYCTDYDPFAPFLFEVKASVEQLACLIGQLHEYGAGYDGENGQYRHGRKSCDPVLGAISDLEAAKLVVVVREFDIESGTNKAMRLFLTPKFFKGFGLTMDEVQKMMANTMAWQKKRNQLVTAKKKRQAETLRLAESTRVASLNKPALKNLLARLRREFTGEDKKSKDVVDAHERAKVALTKAIKAKKQPQRCPIEQRLIELKCALPPVFVFEETDTIKRTHHDLTPQRFNELLVAALERRI